MSFWTDGTIGEFFFHAGTFGIFKVADNYDRADEFSRLDQDGREKWEGDRTIISSEWARLSADSGLTMDKASVTDPEQFSTWSHLKIWEALNGKDGAAGVDATEVNAGADGWRRLTTGTETAVNTYRTNFERVLSEKWSGQSGNAAIDAVKSYTTDAAKLHTAFQMVANGIDHMEGLLGQAKIAIPKPENVSSFDEFISHIPGNGVVKAAKHRATEAEEDARLFMIGTYQPGSIVVDKQTPVLPLPVNNTENPGDGDPKTRNGNDGTTNGTTNNNGTTPGTDPAGTQENPGTTSPQTTDTGDDQNDDGTDDSSDDDSTSPSSTDPSATTPATTTPGTGQPTTPGDTKTGGSPGGGSPGSGVSTGAGVPGAGRSVSGTPGGAASGARAATAGTAGARGMSGMPGMMGGGRGGNGKDDENEHTSPDYLIQDRESELIGQLPPTLPPGGVIGA
ncbi:hypothetical protein [Nocardia canadensis]|uniref:hypothetical protein n=1 Tax=Nocardia canadensis TaxID=3065238 RepID=UPI00292EDAC4|nr:hypothetical protein [Nocardia canadensis]